jgi:transposase
VATTADQLPEDKNALQAALLETRAKLSGAEALIEHLQLVIAKMRRELFGPRSERSQRLLDQLELQLEELAAAAGEDEAKAETASVPVQGFVRRPKTRRNFPDHLPRRRIVHPAPTCCPRCGGTKLSKIGEDVTKTLDVVPRQLFVTEHVREKFSCRACEKIHQPPAPFHVIARGFAGPSLLAMILVDKYANHQPLNRQSEQFAREGVELSVSTMADHVGACAAALTPLYELIKAHVFAAERIHGDETPVPVLAKVKTRVGRLWTYVRDDRPFGGADPPAAVFFYSPDRAGEHPQQHLAEAFTRFLEDGRICISNNAAERALRGIALGRKSWLFAGSDRGGERAAIMFTLVQTAKLNDVDPQAWLADVLARIADHKITDLAALLPWNWRLARMDRAA